ncbi:imm11 family protein [Bradyrhizobium sp.]|uniref:imm11 family protein n=1 Tax=Bradyrhizobium sp. TaxID=376 RepID=UPI004037DCAE
MKKTKGDLKTAAVSPAGERKYFQLDVDFGFPSAPQRIWVNEKKIRENFRSDPHKPFRGLTLSEPPKIAFDRKKRRGALRDADTIMLGIWLVSDRLKNLLERIDPEAFAFERAEVDYSNFDEPGPAFWFCDIVRMLDCVDEENSVIRYQEDISWTNYLALIDVRMKPEIVGAAHAFRLTKSTLIQIVDDVIVKAAKAEKIRGFRFTNIQQD